MKCPKCGHRWKRRAQQRGGRAKVSKGFASPEVMAKALATRARNRKLKQREEAPDFSGAISPGKAKRK